MDLLNSAPGGTLRIDFLGMVFMDGKVLHCGGLGRRCQYHNKKVMALNYTLHIVS